MAIVHIFCRPGIDQAIGLRGSPKVEKVDEMGDARVEERGALVPADT